MVRYDYTHTHQYLLSLGVAQASLPAILIEPSLINNYSAMASCGCDDARLGCSLTEIRCIQGNVSSPGLTHACNKRAGIFVSLCVPPHRITEWEDRQTY